ncbi:hypothetical protein D9M68_953660 [compost metagenome]
MAADEVIVLDHEDQFFSALRDTARRLLGQCHLRRVGNPEIEYDRGAVANFGTNADLSARLLDEAINHAETKSGSLTDFLGGKERLEDLGQQFGRNAMAGVRNG